jgi:hypothetical protein
MLSLLGLWWRFSFKQLRRSVNAAQHSIFLIEQNQKDVEVLTRLLQESKEFTTNEHSLTPSVLFSRLMSTVESVGLTLEKSSVSESNFEIVELLLQGSFEQFCLFLDAVSQASIPLFSCELIRVQDHVLQGKMSFNLRTSP